MVGVCYVITEGLLMALGSEIAVERASVNWEVAPTKGAIGAFMETLVDPKLPYECSVNDIPSEDDQKSMARQVILCVCVCVLFYLLLN